MLSGPASSTAPKYKTPIFFRIGKPGFPDSFLFGTNHQATFVNCPFQPEASEGFQQATHVLSEAGQAAIESNQLYEAALKLQKTLVTMPYTDLFRPVAGESPQITAMRTALHGSLLTFFRKYPWEILPESTKQTKQNYIRDNELVGMPVSALLENVDFLLNHQLKHRWISKLFLLCSPSYLWNYLWNSLFYHYAKKQHRKMLNKQKLTGNPCVAQSDPHYETAMDARITMVAMKQHKQLIPLETTENQRNTLKQLFQGLGAEKQFASSENLMALASDDEREKVSKENLLKRISDIFTLINTHPKQCLIAIRKGLSKSYFFKIASQSALDEILRQYNSQSFEKDEDDIINNKVRNRRWLPTLVETLQHPSFIFVGAGHLGYVGDPEDGLLVLLRNAGFTVTPIECPHFQATIPSPLESKLAITLSSAQKEKESLEATLITPPSLTPGFSSTTSSNSSSSISAPSPNLSLDPVEASTKKVAAGKV